MIGTSRRIKSPTSACTSSERPTRGIYVSGAKVVATGSVLTNYTFIAHHGLIPLNDKKFALVFMVPTNAPGVKFLCRTSYEMTATVMSSPFDQPLSSRLDENDAVFIMDNVFVPWENVFVFGDVEKANNFFPRTGFLPRFVVHGCTRLAVKLDFIAGLLLKAVEASGTKDYRGVQANVGEVIAWRNMFWALTEAMVRDPRPWKGRYLLPNTDPGNAYQVLATIAYTEDQVPDRADGRVGLDLPELARARLRQSRDPALHRPLHARQQRLHGRAAHQAHEAAVGLHRHGVRRRATSSTRSTTAAARRRFAATRCSARIGNGNAAKFKGFAEQCMAEYDLDGWTVPDLINPDDLSLHGRRKARTSAKQTSSKPKRKKDASK